MQQPVVTLFKTEFLNYPQLCKQLDILPEQVTDSEFFYAYSPPFRKLSKVLKVLKQNGVIHGIHFESQKSAGRKTARNTLQSQFIQV